MVLIIGWFFLSSNRLHAQPLTKSEPILATCQDPLISWDQQLKCSKEKIVQIVGSCLSLPDSLKEVGYQSNTVLRLIISPNGDGIISVASDTGKKFISDLIEKCNKTMPSFVWSSNHESEYHYDIPIKWLMHPISSSKSTYQLEWGPLKGSSISRTELLDCKSWQCKLRHENGLEIQPFILKVQAFKGRNLAAEFIEDPWGISASCAAIIQKKKITKVTLEATFREEGQRSEKQVKRSFLINSD